MERILRFVFIKDAWSFLIGILFIISHDSSFPTFLRSVQCISVFCARQTYSTFNIMYATTVIRKLPSSLQSSWKVRNLLVDIKESKEEGKSREGESKQQVSQVYFR